jgi:hypothetical protein
MMKNNLFPQSIILSAMALNLLGFAAAAAGYTDIPAWLGEFDDPPSWARPQIFFVWNGELNKDRIARMLEQHTAEGVGGVFVHARPGLITEYLSEEWFEMWRSTLEKCRAWVWSAISMMRTVSLQVLPAERSSLRILIWPPAT